MAKRHRRIRAHDTTGPVAGAATDLSGSKPIAQRNGLPNLRSPESPCPGQPNLRPSPDSSPPSDSFMTRFAAASLAVRETPPSSWAVRTVAVRGRLSPGRAREGPAWDHSRGTREQTGWGEDAAFMDGLAEEGVVVLSGPIGEGDGEVFLLVVDADGEATMRARPTMRARLVERRVARQSPGH